MTEDGGLERDEIVVIETNVDTVTGEILGALMERLFAEGALDVSFMALQMKKNRPGVLVRVIALPAGVERLAALIVREIPTLGVRLMPMQRLIAARRSETVASPFGPVSVKLKLLAGRVIDASPEYEDRRRLAAAANLPLLDLMTDLRVWLRERYGVAAEDM